MAVADSVRLSTLSLVWSKYDEQAHDCDNRPNADQGVAELLWALGISLFLGQLLRLGLIRSISYVQNQLGGFFGNVELGKVTAARKPVQMSIGK